MALRAMRSFARAERADTALAHRTQRAQHFSRRGNTRAGLSRWLQRIRSDKAATSAAKHATGQLRARHGDQLIMKLLLPRQRRRAVIRTVRMQQPLARAGEGHVQQLVRPANGRELLLRGLGTLALHLGLGARLGEFLSELSGLAGR